MEQTHPSVNTTIESSLVDVNKTGYNEEPAKYMAAPKKQFNDALKRALEKRGLA